MTSIQNLYNKKCVFVHLTVRVKNDHLYIFIYIYMLLSNEYIAMH